MATFELIEIDPATGEEDQVLATGTWAKCQARFEDNVNEMQADVEDTDGHASWGWLRIQPAQ